MLSGRILTTVVMLTIFAGMSVMAIDYPPKARFLPLLVGIPGTILALAQLVIDARQSLREGANGGSTDAVDTAEQAREARMFLWLGLFFAGVLAFGFLHAAPLLVFGFLRFSEGESWLTALIGGVGAWVILYVVFVRLLGLYMFDGLLLPLIFV